MDTEVLMQFQAMLGIVDEGQIVSDDDCEMSLEISYEEIREKGGKQ